MLCAGLVYSPPHEAVVEAVVGALALLRARRLSLSAWRLLRRALLLPLVEPALVAGSMGAWSDAPWCSSPAVVKGHAASLAWEALLKRSDNT